MQITFCIYNLDGILKPHLVEMLYVALYFISIMNSNRQFDNKNLKSRTNYLLWLLFLITLFFGLQLLNPILKPNRYSGSITEWIISISLILLLIYYYIFYKRFVGLIFDDLTKKITLKTMTIANGIKTDDYMYSSISYIIGKTPPTLRKRQTPFIEIYNDRKKIIKIQRSSVDESTFDLMVIEFQKLKNDN